MFRFLFFSAYLVIPRPSGNENAVPGVCRCISGIAPLNFESLRVISYPGGQQYGAINPCEMNEFSDECEAWEAENGPYERGEFMVRSNPRTKGR